MYMFSSDLSFLLFLILSENDCTGFLFEGFFHYLPWRLTWVESRRCWRTSCSPAVTPPALLPARPPRRCSAARWRARAWRPSLPSRWRPNRRGLASRRAPAGRSWAGRSAWRSGTPARGWRVWAWVGQRSRRSERWRSAAPRCPGCCRTSLWLGGTPWCSQSGGWTCLLRNTADRRPGPGTWRPGCGCQRKSSQVWIEERELAELECSRAVSWAHIQSGVFTPAQ